MHSRCILAVVALLSFVTIAPQTAVGQSVIELPIYAVGDFWTYEIILAPLADIVGEEEIAGLSVGGNITITIQALEDAEIEGESVSVYNASHSLDFQVRGSADLTIGEISAGFSVFGSATMEGSLLLRQEGLEPLRAESDTSAILNLTTDISPVPFTAGSVTGTQEVTIKYTHDSWAFPLETGDAGEERFRSTGQGGLQLILLGNTTDFPFSYSLNGTVQYLAQDEEEVTVPAGTFGTLVVNSTLKDEDGQQLGYELAYWSSSAGAPVKRDMFSTGGELITALNLTDHRYQEAERLTILGLDVIYWIPIAAGVAVIVVVLLLIARRSKQT